MAVIKITKENFENEVLKSDKPVLIDFWASWCGPCSLMSPVIDEIADETEDKKICKVNVDEQPELASAFGIDAIPAFILINGGKAVSALTGMHSKDDITGMLKQGNY